MTDAIDAIDDPNEQELANLAGLLSRADVWDEPPPGLADSVAAAIGAEAGREHGTRREGTSTTDLASAARRARRSQRWSGGRLLAAAAAMLLIVAGVAIVTAGGDDGRTFALSGTEAAPDATGVVDVAATPAGLKLVLDVEGLDGAPEGFMYEAWVGSDDVTVSAGSFHLRGGDDPIELWAGVADDEFRRFWITLEPLDDDLGPSGDARLRGEISIAVADG